MTHKHLYVFHFLSPLKPCTLLSLSLLSSTLVQGILLAIMMLSHWDAQWGFPGLCSSSLAQNPVLCELMRDQKPKQISACQLVQQQSRCSALTSFMDVCAFLDVFSRMHFPIHIFPNVKPSGKVFRNSAAFSAADLELFIWKVFRLVCWHLSPCVQYCLGSAWRGMCTSALPRREEALVAYRQLSRYNLKSFLVCRVQLQLCGWEQPSR